MIPIQAKEPPAQKVDDSDTSLNDTHNDTTAKREVNLDALARVEEVLTPFFAYLDAACGIPAASYDEQLCRAQEIGELKTSLADAWGGV